MVIRLLPLFNLYSNLKHSTMKLSENAINLLAQNEELQNKAYKVLVDMCKKNGKKIGFSSFICIDLNLGFIVGVRSCNLKGLYINEHNEVLTAETVDIETGNEIDVSVQYKQSIEILQILQDAIISEEDEFIKRYPDKSSNFTDADLEDAWKLLSEVNINNRDEIEQDFLYWPAGTYRQNIWRWFDKKHSKGVGYLNDIA